ncbi:MAG: ribonuclease III [Candidatus Krumholzibacteriota bacterium]|nr:ribonuclease III [Candidatus Krumholzibacteriota bacterium]
MKRLTAIFRRLFGAGRPAATAGFGGFEKKIGYRFENGALLLEALTHRSTLGELRPGESGITYERFEFLGDSVLALVTSDYLVRNFPDEDEGQLTQKKSLLVSQTVLAKKAVAIDLASHIIVSGNASRGGVADQDSVTAAALEAVIGAVYLDGGLEPARDLIEELILDDIDKTLEHSDHINYKSLIQELTQSRFKTYPIYKVRSTSGPEHDKVFLVEVHVAGRIRGKGRGKSKKDAEQMAAKNALSNMRHRHRGRRGGKSDR